MRPGAAAALQLRRAAGGGSQHHGRLFGLVLEPDPLLVSQAGPGWAGTGLPWVIENNNGNPEPPIPGSLSGERLGGGSAGRSCSPENPSIGDGAPPCLAALGRNVAAWKSC